MKKAFFLICSVALVSLGLVSISLFPGKVPFPGNSIETDDKRGEQGTKYSDCIDSTDLMVFLKRQSPPTKQSEALQKVEASLEKYGRSMDSVIENLSTLEAHQYLHEAYKNNRSVLQSDSMTKTKFLYHLGAMQICYDRDKSLSHNMGFYPKPPSK
nr:hypothetical protein [Allomuricauda sp.]